MGTAELGDLGSTGAEQLGQTARNAAIEGLMWSRWPPITSVRMTLASTCVPDAPGRLAKMPA